MCYAITEKVHNWNRKECPILNTHNWYKIVVFPALSSPTIITLCSVNRTKQLLALRKTFNINVCKYLYSTSSASKVFTCLNFQKKQILKENRQYSMHQKISHSYKSKSMQKWHHKNKCDIRPSIDIAQRLGDKTLSALKLRMLK